MNSINILISVSLCYGTCAARLLAQPSVSKSSDLRYASNNELISSIEFLGPKIGGERERDSICICIW
ncbi:hypothetical protein VNO77_40663 [Canavalia gladiata]|uniref:Uncharacterized protein n=1 Tax=Canavalia gladiata TaxID=3824 RepID=A0AAN9K1N7_CANGL